MYYLESYVVDVLGVELHKLGFGVYKDAKGKGIRSRSICTVLTPIL